MRFLLAINIFWKLAALFVVRVSPAVALALWFVPDALLAYHIFAPRSQGSLHMQRRFTTAHRELWLTIDDGPDPEDTPQILKLLAKHEARATFFVIGERASLYPELIRAISAAGHEVANHTHTHPLISFWCASPRRVCRELDACMDALAEEGVLPTRFRPPAGIKNLWLASALAERGLTPVGWSAHGMECLGGDDASVAAMVTKGLAPGSILLLHEGPKVPAHIRVAAIGRVLEQVHALGYRCVIPGPEQLSGR